MSSEPGRRRAHPKSAALWPTWTNDPDVDRMWAGWLMSVVGAAAVPWGYLATTGRKDVSYANR